jgi:hypothetical protein
MRLRSLAFLLALLPGLLAPVGLSWCGALCTALRATERTQPVTRAAHGCCDRGPAPVAPTGPQLAKGCEACELAPVPRSDLSRLEAAAAAMSLALAPASVAPQLQPFAAPAPPLRADFAPPATAGPARAPLPLRF